MMIQALLLKYGRKLAQSYLYSRLEDSDTMRCTTGLVSQASKLQAYSIVLLLLSFDKKVGLALFDPI